MAKVLTTVPSSSGNGTYEIRHDEARGVLYCVSQETGKVCRGWQFSKAEPKTCRHIQQSGESA